MVIKISAILWTPSDQNSIYFTSEKILHGDENAARLLGTPLTSIYPARNSTDGTIEKIIPTRIRFRYYLYEFKDSKRSALTVVKYTLQNIISRYDIEHYLLNSCN